VSAVPNLVVLPRLPTGAAYHLCGILLGLLTFRSIYLNSSNKRT
jgi:hypothetical protein